MKKIAKLFFLNLFVSLFYFTNANPIWERNIAGIADSINMIPKKVLSNNNGVFVLLKKQYVSANPSLGNIIVRKYSFNGDLIWEYVDSVNSFVSGTPADMVLDNVGNIYVCGSYIGEVLAMPVVIGISANGTELWRKTSFVNLLGGELNSIYYKGNSLWLSGSIGIAKLSTTGTETWSSAIPANFSTLDSIENLVISSFGANNNLIKFNSNGVQINSDSTLFTERITTDINNNIYIATSTDNFHYHIKKFNSNLVVQWDYVSAFEAPPFGDIGFELICDDAGNLFAVGFNDKLLKFSPSGELLWQQSLNGTDDYLISAKRLNNFISIAGTFNGFAGSDCNVKIFNTNGQLVYENYYAGMVGGSSEYSTSHSIDQSSIYMTSVADMDARLTKFETVSQQAIYFPSLCVDSIWYDSLDPTQINIRVYNGGLNQLNYPSIRIIAPNGDTICNPDGTVDFFAHIVGMQLTYMLPIFVQGITDFSNYNFLMGDSFNDTTGLISNSCIIPVPTSIGEKGRSITKLFPNPSSETINLINDSFLVSGEYSIFNTLGSQVARHFVYMQSKQIQLEINDLGNGLYFIKTPNGEVLRFVKE